MNNLNRKHNVNLLAIVVSLVLLLGICGAAMPGRSLAETPSGWYKQTSGVSGDIYSISAVSQTTAWACGVDGVLKTTNGGATWEKQTLPDTGRAVCVSAVNGQVAWIAGSSVYRTTNGGATWKTVRNYTGSVHTGAYGVAVCATDSTTAWVSDLNWMAYEPPMPTYWCDIVKTTDGGTTWSSPQTSLRPASLTKFGLCAVDRSTAWAAAMADIYHPLITKTSPGEGWETQFSPTSGLSCLVDIDASDANNAWAVGEFNQPFGGGVGAILHTSDGGIGWQSQDSHISHVVLHLAPLLAGVSAVDAKTAWAVGNAGVIVKTTDGENWAPQTSGVTTDLWSISAVDANTAWAVGTGGVILHTTDGGGAPVQYPDLQSVTLNEDQTQVIIQGSGFGNEPGSMEILMGRVEWDYGYPDVKQTWSLNDYTSWSDEEIHCVMPAAEQGISPGVYEVALRHGNYASSKRFFALGQYSTVASITPYSGANNAILDVTMTGYGFDAPNLAVQVSNASASIPVSDVVVNSPTELTCRLDLTGQPAGKYDVHVAGDYPTSAYLNGFTVLEPRVYEITPGSAANLWTASYSISGVGFLPGATASLESGTTIINATDVEIKSGSLITCKFNLQYKALGKYDVVVRNPGPQELRLTGGFTVTNACGQGAAISVSLFAGLLGLLSMAGLGWRRKRFKA